MAFEDIERVGPKPVSSVPDDGVRVSTRAAAGRGNVTRYIQVQIGGGLAKALSLIGDETALKLQFGTGADAGRVAMSVNVSVGQFPARRKKNGGYTLTINAASAEGLFALDFPAFTVDEAEVIHTQGKSPVAVFEASPGMLAVED